MRFTGHGIEFEDIPLAQEDAATAPTKKSLAERVCLVLEIWAMGLDELEIKPGSEQEYLRFATSAYMFTHIARNPSCMESHKDWLQEFEELEQAMRESGELK